MTRLKSAFCNYITVVYYESSTNYILLLLKVMYSIKRSLLHYRIGSIGYSPSLIIIHLVQVLVASVPISNMTGELGPISAESPK